MAFSRKDHNSIWKGEGIYFLTFVVKGRRKLLGTLVPIASSRWHQENVQPSLYYDGKGRPICGQGITSQPANSHGANALPANSRPTNGPVLNTSTLAITNLTPFGMAVSREIQNLPNRVEGLKVCAKQIMPDHIHVVVWITKDTGRTIRQIGNGFRIGIKKAAIALGIHQDNNGHILDIPFIRALAHKGQLRSMIDYVHANPDNALVRQLNPELYVIHRDIQLAGLQFDGMGKDRLLAYPDRQVIPLSRSFKAGQRAAEVAQALHQAERGAVTYTAAINDGEKAVAKAIRKAGHPLVVMMLDGFPPEGTEAALYFHPEGIYHKACGEGRLMLLAPKPGNYQNPTLIALTEQELAQKAQAKGQHYHPIPHDTKRWRMIAGNVMLRMIAETQGG